MKTAISLPEELLQRADRLARRTGKSRSQLFREALREYIARHQPDELTQVMDRVLDELGQPAEAFTAETARRVLEDVEW